MMDSLTLPALTRASGTVRLPGSKSISNRMLLLAALALGSDGDPRPAGFR
jgi:3-phosphoshikimate 1-carboxyvinyltransferase